MTVTNKNIALTAGQSHLAQIMSEFPPLTAAITNEDANSAVMTFTDPGPIYLRLRVASWIGINPDHGQPMVYPLNLVDRGLQRLLACTLREMGFPDYGSQAVGDPFGAGLPIPRISRARSMSAMAPAAPRNSTPSTRRPSPSLPTIFCRAPASPGPIS